MQDTRETAEDIQAVVAVVIRGDVAWAYSTGITEGQTADTWEIEAIHGSSRARR